MKKIFRFIVAAVTTPLMLTVAFIDWLVEEDDYEPIVFNVWLKWITFKG